MNADFSGVIENSHDRHNLINKQKLLKYMPHIAVRILEFLEELTSANIKLLHFEEMFLTNTFNILQNGYQKHSKSASFNLTA